MLVPNPRQNVPFTLLDVDFQQINPRDTLLVNDFEAFALAESYFLKQEAQKPHRHRGEKPLLTMSSWCHGAPKSPGVESERIVLPG